MGIAKSFRETFSALVLEALAEIAGAAAGAGTRRICAKALITLRL
jgi:hypothetical protein